jgi:hypothetical protein
VVVCIGTSLKLAADEGPADEVAPAAGDVVGDRAEDAEEVAWAVADELEPCELHPMMRTAATARAAPVSNVRRAAILVILLNPLSTTTVHAKHDGEHATIQHAFKQYQTISPNIKV